MDVVSGVSQEGKILAWEFHNYNGGASLGVPYRIPNRYAAYHASESTPCDKALVVPLPPPSISYESFDAGAVVNQGILSNQIEGAIVQGIGGALFEQLEFDKPASRMAAFLPIVCRGSVTFPKLKSFSSTVGAFPPPAPVNLRSLQPPPSEQPFCGQAERLRQLTMLPLFSSERT
jgi:hypothetical protein